MNIHEILNYSFFQRDTLLVAQELIGTHIVRRLESGKLLIGMITETECYKGDQDPASHAYKGITPRNAGMFGQVGCAYVYFIYGNHYCFNIVARDDSSQAGAVLIRSIKPIEGIEHMKKFRQKRTEQGLTNGPGKLTQALCINKNHNALNVTVYTSEIYIIKNVWHDSYVIESTPRIGIKKAVELPWRFVYKE